jgi:hypothetical protein
MKFLIHFIFFMSFSNALAFVPEEAHTFDFNVKMIGMGRIKEEKVYASLEILRQVFASPEFRRRILRHRFRGRYAFANNRGLSNVQIYRKLLNGVEKLFPYRNNAMDVEIELYSDYQSTVLGFTRPNTPRIWMNQKYFNRHTPVEVASHLTHEWLHKLGFDHEKKRCQQRKYSVPYAIGYIVKDLAKRFQR